MTRCKKRIQAAAPRRIQSSPPLRGGIRRGAAGYFGADPVDHLPTLWITLSPSGPIKRVFRVGLAVSAVALFGCQKDSWFCSWTLWITTLTLRVRHRPSGSAPI